MYGVKIKSALMLSFFQFFYILGKTYYYLYMDAHTQLMMCQMCQFSFLTPVCTVVYTKQQYTQIYNLLTADLLCVRSLKNTLSQFDSIV